MKANNAPQAVLQVDALKVAYGRHLILNGLELSIGKGEIFGLLGPNGSGKTTLIRSICGRVTLAAGHIHIAGISNQRREAVRRIGLVPQEIALYQHLTIRENLVAFGRLSGLSAKETARALPWALEAAKLSERLNDPVHTLSGGWKRRANIAAAILHDPALLILDEPTVGIDIDARAALHAVIQDLSQAGLSVLLATHDLEQAEVLCGRVGFMRQGSLDPVGSPAALLSKAFEGQSDVSLRLLERAPQGERAALLAMGFTESVDGLEWNGLIRASRQDQAELVDAFHQSGLKIKEVRYREPGLDTLFLHLKNADGTA